MNCFEWKKHITGNVAVTVSYNETGDGYSITGGGTVTHGELYAGWTRRELQCEGMPMGAPDNWILRPNLCEGRSVLIGLLTPLNGITITQNYEGLDPIVENWPVWFQAFPSNYEATTGLLPMSPYPDWENDPWSVASRAAIDGLTFSALYVSVSQFPPSPEFISPSAVPLRWLKDGESGTSPDGFATASLTLNFAIA